MPESDESDESDARTEGGPRTTTSEGRGEEEEDEGCTGGGAGTRQTSHTASAGMLGSHIAHTWFPAKHCVHANTLLSVNT